MGKHKPRRDKKRVRRGSREASRRATAMEQASARDRARGGNVVVEVPGVLDTASVRDAETAARIIGNRLALGE